MHNCDSCNELLEMERHQRLQSFGMGGRKAVEGLFDQDRPNLSGESVRTMVTLEGAMDFLT